MKTFEFFKNGTSHGNFHAKNIEDARKKVFATFGEELPVCEVIEEASSETTYVLFGERVSRIYNSNNDLQQIAGEIKNGNGTYAVIDDSWGVHEILEFADGWNGYATMTETDYNKLIELLN